MLKVVIDKEGSNLCIERGSTAGSIKLTAYNSDAEIDISVVVDRAELNKSIAFVLDEVPSEVVLPEAPVTLG